MWARWGLLGALFLAGCSTGLDPDDTGDTDTADTDTGDTDTADTDTGDTDTADTDTGDTDSGDTDTDSGDTDTDTDTDTGTSTGCVDDTREPDDDLDDATPYTAPVTGQICADDEDWFAVTAGAGCIVDVHLDFAQAAGDLDLYLVDEDGLLLDLGISEDDDEAISFVAPTAGTLYVAVAGYDGAENAYGLAVTQTCPSGAPTCPGDDIYEENDDAAGARWLNLDFTALEGVVCADDEDWYALYALPGCVMGALAEFSHAAGDLDLYLLDADEFVVESSVSEDDDEGIVHTFIEEGLYYVVVSGYDAGDTAVYDLSAFVDCATDPPETCAEGDDWYEENDDPEDAFPLNSGLTALDAITCPGDADWFVLPLVPYGCVGEVLLDFDPEAADLDLRLYDEFGFLVGTSASSDATEYQQWIADLDSALYVEVTGYDGATGPYTLYSDVTCPDTLFPTCPDDDFWEDNDTAVTGLRLNDVYTLLDAAACDDDWYWNVAGPGCWFQAGIAFDGDDGALDLDLYDGSDLVDLSWGTGDVEYVSYIPDILGASSTLFDVLAYPVTAGDATAYVLESSTTCLPAPPTCADDDLFAPNHEPADAVDLNPVFTRLEGVRCEPEASDWFRAEVPADCELWVDLYFVDSAGDLDLYVWNGAATTVLAESESVTDDEFVTLPATSSDRVVRVEVYAADFLDNDYWLVSEVVCD